MKRLLLFACVIPICVYFASCSCHGTIQCSDGSLLFRTVGYTITDIDSMLLVRYQQDNNFDIVIDTTRLYNNNGYGMTNGDTCNLDWGAPTGYDYKIIFPTAGTSYAISNIKAMGPSSEEVTYKCEEGTPTNGNFCEKSISSFTVNGQTYTGNIPAYSMVR